MRKIILLTSILICLCLHGFAQKYGGVAYVTGKSSEGEIRVIYHARTCDFSSEAEAKENLKKTLEAKAYDTEELISSITYDVSRCTDSKDNNHGGRAMVEIKDFKSGKIRFEETTIPCELMNTPDPVDVKRVFWSKMESSLAYNESFISPIKFYIDSCKNKFKK